ncbi:MAG TPA: neutral/alkaline non-lysosomal ceramidase N-terminal domain-containing protein, partial [Chryseosolibacter sp.]
MKSIKFYPTWMLCVLMLSGIVAFAQTQRPGALIDVGVARVDITPEGPIRLTGYAARPKKESDGVIHRLYAKALAIGNDSQRPTILITVDLVGIPGSIRGKVAAQLAEKVGIDPAHLAICASHTHGGPEVGNLLNILQYRGDHFSDSLLALDQMAHLSTYIDQLGKKLEEVALAAMNDRKPSLLSWGQGQAAFGINRRTPGGPVDTALPLLRVTDADGKLKAVFLNYACHGTTLGADVNKVHGDWIAEAQKDIEAGHPGVTAMIALGCAGDQNPDPRGTIEDMEAHGREIVRNVDKLLTAQLQPLTSPPQAEMKWIQLPFAHVPTVDELIAQAADASVKGYYARLALDRVARGQEIPHVLDYPVQVWTFGNELAMINLAGEVVVDYSTRLKNELGAEALWVNAYSNDVPSYIASRRVIGEGGYEADASMYWYNKPSPFDPKVEDLIVTAVHELMPESFKAERPENNSPKVVQPGADNVILLKAEDARA